MDLPRERSMTLFGIRRLMNNIISENGFLWRLQKIIIIFNQHQLRRVEYNIGDSDRSPFSCIRIKLNGVLFPLVGKAE